MSNATQKYKEGLEDVFKDVEYIEISKNGIPLYTFTEKEVNGITKFEFQKMLGKKFGVDRFSASMKFKNNYTNKKFPIRSIVLGEVKNVKDNNNGQSVNKIDELENIIKQIPNQNPAENYTQLLDLTKLTYENEINRLRETIQEQKNEIADYKKEVKELNKENVKLIKKIDEAENEGGNNFVDMLLQLNQLRGVLKTGSGMAKNSSSLKNVKSDVSDIPEEMLEALGKVDYSKIPKQDIQKYIMLFENISNQLPLKSKD